MNNYRFLEMRVNSQGIKKMTQMTLADKLNIPRQRIQQLEKSPSVIPTSEELRAYCLYFNTTSDYLLNISDVKVIDENISMINKTTGLSDKAVVKLKGLDTYSKKILNDFIVNENFEFLLLAMREYISLQNCKVSITDIMTGENQIVSNPKWMLKYPATEIFSRILDDIYNGYDKK